MPSATWPHISRETAQYSSRWSDILYKLAVGHLFPSWSAWWEGNLLTGICLFVHEGYHMFSDEDSGPRSFPAGGLPQSYYWSCPKSCPRFCLGGYPVLGQGYPPWVGRGTPSPWIGQEVAPRQESKWCYTRWYASCSHAGGLPCSFWVMTGDPHLRGYTCLIVVSVMGDHMKLLHLPHCGLCDGRSYETATPASLWSVWWEIIWNCYTCLIVVSVMGDHMKLLHLLHCGQCDEGSTWDCYTCLIVVSVKNKLLLSFKKPIRFPIWMPH